MTAESFEGWRKNQIAVFLRSDRPLSPGHREWLAKFVEGKIKLRRGRRPGYNNGNWTERERVLRIAECWVNDSIAERVAAGEKRRGLNAKVIEAVATECCPAGMDPADFQERLANWLTNAHRRR